MQGQGRIGRCGRSALRSSTRRPARLAPSRSNRHASAPRTLGRGDLARSLIISRASDFAREAKSHSSGRPTADEAKGSASSISAASLPNRSGPPSWIMVRAVLSFRVTWTGPASAIHVPMTGKAFTSSRQLLLVDGGVAGDGLTPSLLKPSNHTTGGGDILHAFFELCEHVGQRSIYPCRNTSPSGRPGSRQRQDRPRPTPAFSRPKPFLPLVNSRGTRCHGRARAGRVLEHEMSDLRSRNAREGVRAAFSRNSLTDLFFSPEEVHGRSTGEPGVSLLRWYFSG
jgi:hypothetical protein